MQEEGRLRFLTGSSVSLQLQGTLRIILDPLLVDKPFVGAVTLFFLQKPASLRDERQACRSLGESTGLLGPRRWA